jgi:hypothetical protein
MLKEIEDFGVSEALIKQEKKIESLVPESWKDKLDIPLGTMSYAKTPQDTLFHDLPKPDLTSEGMEETAQKALAYEAARVAKDRVMSMSTRQKKSFGIHDRRIGLAVLFDHFGFFLSRLVETDPNIFAKYFFLSEISHTLQIDQLRLFIFFITNINGISGCHTRRDLVKLILEWKEIEEKVKKVHQEMNKNGEEKWDTEAK